MNLPTLTKFDALNLLLFPGSLEKVQKTYFSRSYGHKNWLPVINLAKRERNYFYGSVALGILSYLGMTLLDSNGWVGSASKELLVLSLITTTVTTKRLHFLTKFMQETINKGYFPLMDPFLYDTGFLYAILHA